MRAARRLDRLASRRHVVDQETEMVKAHETPAELALIFRGPPPALRGYGPDGPARVGEPHLKRPGPPPPPPPPKAAPPPPRPPCGPPPRRRQETQKGKAPQTPGRARPPLPRSC